MKTIFTKEKLDKVFKGSLIAGSGAVIAYLATVVSSFDWAAHGEMGLAVGAIASILINVLRVLLQDK